MSKALQLYYNTVFGALGGLAAWFLVGLFNTGAWNLWLATMFIGAGTGLFIGSAVGSVEGVVVKRSVSRAMLGLILGAVAGVLSGVIGLLIGQLGFVLTGGGFIGRALGWTALGLFLGIGQGLVARKFKRAFYGLIGGTLAGLVGGLVYEAVTQLFLQQSGTVQVFLGALGLVIIGASLGGITAFSVDVIERVVGRGMLIVKDGKRAGLEVTVADVVTLGSYDGCEVYLPGDKGIEKKHARVSKRGGQFAITDLGSLVGTYVDGQRVPPGDAGLPLRPRAQIRLGNTTVEFKAG